MNKIPKLRTLSQFAEAHPAFSEASLRWLRFNQETNNFKSAFLTVSRRVLIDEAEFFRVIAEQNGRNDSEGGI